MEAIKELSNLSKDDILAALGLERKNSHDTAWSQSAASVSASLGIFGAGLLVGAGLGLIFAPRSGRSTRRDLSKRVDHLAERAKNTVQNTIEELHN